MIDVENIIISDICPIQFAKPLEYELYKYQDIFEPKILSNTNCIQVLISEELYTSNKALLLNMYNCSEELISSFSFSKYELSSGIYVADCYIDFTDKNISNSYAYFTIENDSSVLASSLLYLIKPTSFDDVKRIQFWHNENDFNFVFNAETSIIKLPVSKDFDNVFEYITSEIIDDKLYFKAKAIESNYSGTIKIVLNEILEGVIIVKNITISGNSEFSDYVLIDAISDKNFQIYVLTNDNNNYICNSTNYLSVTDKIRYTNKVTLDIECGFKPHDSYDEQSVEDFIEQNLSNDTVYGDMVEYIPLTLGDSFGVPSWFRKKFSRASLCDNFYVNDIKLLRTSGSKPEKIEDTGDGLSLWKYIFQLSENYNQVVIDKLGRTFDYSFENIFN